MIPNLPSYINVFFILTTFLTVYLVYRASGNSRLFLVLSSAWLAFQGALGLSGFYTVTGTFPPRLFFLPIPVILLIISLFFSAPGKRFLDRLDLKTLTYLHTLRIPVELVLYWLFIQGFLPELMTFEGRNFDIIAGLTAPIVGYFAFAKRSLGRKALLLWNWISLALLLNIVSIAILSAPTPFQVFAKDIDDFAITFFPFVWLPGYIVPMVLLSHLASIRKLILTESL